MRKLHDHRKTHGTTEFLAEWAGTRNNGSAWDLEWKKANDLTPDLVDGYNKQHGVPTKNVTIDIAVIYEAVRRKVAHALTYGSPTSSGGFNGPNRPRVHALPLDACVVWEVACGVLELARKHGGATLPLQKGNVGADDEWRQLIIVDLDRIATFCHFQHFLDHTRHRENIRLKGQRAHNGDVMVVGQPIMITVKKEHGLANAKLEFPSVHLNGLTGRPTYPHMGSGLLKARAERAKLIRHVRDHLPAEHPLVVNGWAALPAQAWALAAEYAVPA